MAQFYNDQIASYDVTASTADALTGQAPDLRRMYDFSDEVLTLTPDKNPFFTFLANTAKNPVSATVFRYLEDRTHTDWTARDFTLDAHVNSEDPVTAGNSYPFQVDDGSGGKISWLIQGMVFTVATVYSAVGYALVQVRITSAPSINTDDTTFTGLIEQVSAVISLSTVLSADQKCQVIGTNFGEGTGAPDVWSSEMEDNFGYTTIVKTACEMTESAMTEEYRGHKNDWAWRWDKKLIEHLSDIERIALFSQKSRNGNIQSTEGIIGNIIKNGTIEVDNLALSYSSGKPYIRSLDQSELTFDRILDDLEVTADPARGGSSDKLTLASRPIVSFFNKVGDGKFIDSSIGYQYSPWRDKLKEEEGVFGHKMMKIETVNGDLHLVSQPMFRGNSRNLMVMIDLNNVQYRPLAGNGKNRDTFIKTNVQANDEDSRKDMITTEFAIEVSLPETHLLYSVEGL